MLHRFINLMSYRLIVSLAVLALCASCANRGVGPQGGPRDTIPPAVVKELPAYGSLNITNKKLEITFDEYIQLTDPSPLDRKCIKLCSTLIISHFYV